MAEKPKPKKKQKSKSTDKKQSERFVEAARKLGLEETGIAFEEAFDRVVTTRNPKKDNYRSFHFIGLPASPTRSDMPAMKSFTCIIALSAS